MNPSRMAAVLLASIISFATVATGQSPTDEAPPAADPVHVNERKPDIARPPWTAPPHVSESRPYLEAWRVYHAHGACTAHAFPWYGPAMPYAVPLVPCPPVAWPYAPPPADFARALESAYHAGRADEHAYQRFGFNINDMNRRQDRLLTHHERALQLGVARLREGAYARAAVALALATELDRGDPASRIHLAQARLALGHYDDAGRLVRRAFELQPKLLYTDLNLERYYPNDRLLDEFTRALAAWLAERPRELDGFFLLGFLEFQRGNFEESHAALRRVAAGTRKRDDLTAALLRVTRPAVRPTATAAAKAER